MNQCGSMSGGLVSIVRSDRRLGITPQGPRECDRKIASIFYGINLENWTWIAAVETGPESTGSETRTFVENRNLFILKINEFQSPTANLIKKKKFRIRTEPKLYNLIQYYYMQKCVISMWSVCESSLLGEIIQNIGEL